MPKYGEGKKHHLHFGRWFDRLPHSFRSSDRASNCRHLKITNLAPDHSKQTNCTWRSWIEGEYFVIPAKKEGPINLPLFSRHILARAANQWGSWRQAGGQRTERLSSELEDGAPIPRGFRGTLRCFTPTLKLLYVYIHSRACCTKCESICP